MGALFLFAAALQYNDPDPIRWIAIYGAACAVSIAAATGRPVLRAALVVGAVSIAWALFGRAATHLKRLHPHVRFVGNEVGADRRSARGIGLLIVTIWMAVVAAGQRRSAGKTRNANYGDI